MRPNITFSINEYDKDGDITDNGVFLHFGDTRVKVCDSILEFDDVVLHLRCIQGEINDKIYP
jgi:hypothetical protein